MGKFALEAATKSGRIYMPHFARVFSIIILVFPRYLSKKKGGGKWVKYLILNPLGRPTI